MTGKTNSSRQYPSPFLLVAPRQNGTAIPFWAQWFIAMVWEHPSSIAQIRLLFPIFNNNCPSVLDHFQNPSPMMKILSIFSLSDWTPYLNFHTQTHTHIPCLSVFSLELSTKQTLYLFVHCLTALLEQKHHVGRNFSLFCSLLHPQHL